MRTVSKTSTSVWVSVAPQNSAQSYSEFQMLSVVVALGVSLLCGFNPVQAAGKDAPLKQLPLFAKVDKNGDHFVTKDELKDYPVALQYFDRVDAGKDGKLEQLEYDNLVMESKREGELQ